MTTAEIKPTEERTADLRSLQQIMADLKPGERFAIESVMSSQGVCVSDDEAHIIPRTAPDGSLYFDCVFFAGHGRVTIKSVDSFVWDIHHDQ